MAIKQGWDFPSPASASTRAYTRERGVGEKSAAVGRDETPKNAPTWHTRDNPRDGRYARNDRFDAMTANKNEDAQEHRTGRQAVQTNPKRAFATGGQVVKAVDPAASKAAKNWVNDDAELTQRIWSRREADSERKDREAVMPESERRQIAPDFKMKKGGSTSWIAGATKNKGALHKALGVPAGDKIPAKKLTKAEHSKNPTMRKRADLAKTLKGLNKG